MSVRIDTTNYNWDFWRGEYPGVTAADLADLYPKTEGLAREIARRKLAEAEEEAVCKNSHLTS